MGMARFYPAKFDRLKHTLKLTDHLDRNFLQPDSPYKEDTFLASLFRRFVIGSVRLLERLLKLEFLVEDQDRELSVYRKSTRTLLSKLVAGGSVAKWECGMANTEYKSHYVCSLTMGDIKNDRGKLFVKAGYLSSHGSAIDIDSALTTALAEAIERIASSEYPDTRLIKASIYDLEKRGINHFAHSYIEPLTEAQKKTELNWLNARDLQTDSELLIPASMLYIFYNLEHKDEPFFSDTSSNGVATQTSKGQATLRALYESFERDGFLMYWMNKLAPQKIALDSIPESADRAIIDNLLQNDFSVHLFDCKTEYEIPIMVSISIDNKSGGLNVNAVAGLNPDKLLTKLTADMQRWQTNHKTRRPDKNDKPIHSIGERQQFWQSGFLTEHVNFFLKGQAISFQQYKQQFNLSGFAGRELDYVKSKLRKNNSAAYYYDCSNDIACEAGLVVVRAIVPDLMPIYFNESKQHLNVPRLYSFARAMGFKDRDITKDELNLIPHPFI